MATGRIGTTPVLQVRWSKAPSAGTTSLSGLDDNSVSLVYSVGYEAVYRNGVLLSRTNDYTATNGTTVTLIDATIAGDIIEIFANQTIPLADTYSQTVANGKFINNTLTTTTGDIIYASAANTPARLGIGSTDQVLKVSGGIPAWGAGSAMTLISTTNLNAQSVTLSSIPQTYKDLYVVIRNWKPSTDDACYFDFLTAANTVRENPASGTSTMYYEGQSFNNTSINLTRQIDNTTASGIIVFTIPDYTNTTTYKFITGQSFSPNGTTPTTYNWLFFSGVCSVTNAITTFKLNTNASSATATILLYGVN
jgi:hypothetical protein